MIRVGMAASIAVFAGAVFAQAPAPSPTPAAAPAMAPAAQDGMMDCSKAGIYYRQCEESMRRKDPCYGKKDAELAACKSAGSTRPLRVRNCPEKTGEAKTRCEANNARDKATAVASCSGKGGAELDQCVAKKTNSEKRADRTARAAAAPPHAKVPAGGAAKTPGAPSLVGSSGGGKRAATMPAALQANMAPAPAPAGAVAPASNPTGTAATTDASQGTTKAKKSAKATETTTGSSSTGSTAGSDGNSENSKRAGWGDRAAGSTGTPTTSGGATNTTAPTDAATKK